MVLLLSANMTDFFSFWGVFVAFDRQIPRKIAPQNEIAAIAQDTDSTRMPG